jgi:signal transduction histidine kinase
MGFAIPVTLALFGMTWIALMRTRREAEALAMARQEFERREIAETALLRSQRLEAVGQMTGGVAHDFNNLLMVVLAGSEMLLRRAENPAAVLDIAGQINLAARRGGEITQQLLAFSRRQTVNAEIVDLNARLREFKQLLDRAAQEAVRVRLDLDQSLCPVRLDPGHFEAAILNLVGNARDAMAQGGDVVIATRNRVVTAADHPELPAGSYVLVAVTDQGVGMDADAVARAFEPFFTTKEVGKGTGLGLSQVYGFAKQAAGDVRILSVPGRGTTVEIWLPRAKDPVPAGRPVTEALPGGAEAGEVVLVVEDEPAVLAMAVECLSELGYATIAATNASEALSRLQENERVDVLFSDVVMPGGMDGRQLSAEAQRRRPALKVLLTSGYTGGPGKAVVGEAPVLTKPYSRVELAARLRQVLQS